MVWRDLRLALDEEIHRLPEPYREAFVLCHLEGHSNAAAARLLGCPKGTILSRLARARQRLAHRLSRRGITLPAATLTALLSVEMLRADVLASLAFSAVRLVGSLAVEGTPAGVVSAPAFALAAQGGKIMLWMKIIAFIGIMTVAAALTAGDLSLQTAQPPVVPAQDAESKPQRKASKKDKDETPLEKTLRKWAEADAKIGAMHVRFTRTDTDPIFDEKKATTGQVSFKKPDLWRVDHFDKNRRMLSVELLEAKRLHLFDSETKTEKIFPLDDLFSDGNLGGGLYVDVTWFTRIARNMLEQIQWLSFGPQAREMDSGFQLHIVKEDQWYCHLDIKPRQKRTAWFEPDSPWFERGRIVLDRTTWQVRQVWFERVNRCENSVDFLERRTNPETPITRESLLKGLPKRWKRLDFCNPAPKSK